MARPRNPRRGASATPNATYLESPTGLPARALPGLPFQPSIRSPVFTVEDRRSFQADGLDMPRSTRRWHPKIALAKRKAVKAKWRYAPPGYLKSPNVLAFQAPKFVSLCIRRKRRKEVLHALKKTGKKGGRPGRRNYWSNISCKG